MKLILPHLILFQMKIIFWVVKIFFQKKKIIILFLKKNLIQKDILIFYIQKYYFFYLNYLLLESINIGKKNLTTYQKKAFLQKNPIIQNFKYSA